jgi:hypothetical protein
MNASGSLLRLQLCPANGGTPAQSFFRQEVRPFTDKQIELAIRGRGSAVLSCGRDTSP